MANLTKAKHHHAKAGTALDAGDPRAAAHHFGHALAALRTATKTTEDMTMPFESKAQERAMYAAKDGKSTLGIPKTVGADFVAAGPAKPTLPEKVTKLATRLKGMKKK